MGPLACLLLLASTALAGPNDGPRDLPVSARIAELLEPLVDSGKVVGMSVGVIDGDQTYAFGLGSTRRAPGAPVPDGRTVYEIGSISKVFTTTLLAEMAESGEVALDDPLARYVPEGVTVPSRNDKEITLRHLATHASGLPRIPSNLKPNPFDPYRGYTPDDLFGFLSHYALKREPGEHVEYSNYGVGLLGHVLARRAGHDDFEGLLLDRVCRPLGMRDTSLRINADQLLRFAQGYSSLRLPAGRWEILTLGGAGGIRSTVDDMLRFARFGLHPDDSPLGRGIQEARKPLRPMGPNPDGSKIGLAWIVEPDGAVWHNGQTGGYHSFLGLRPDAGKAVVILTNSSNGEVDGAGLRLLRELVSGGSDPR
jgi:CubicO group peptidase (beta-lactamase class C family)